MSTTPASGGLYALKSLTARRSHRVVQALGRTRVGPGHLTGISFVAALGLAGVTMWARGDAPVLVGLIALPVAALRLLTAVWDGLLARETGQESARGAVFAELADQAGDLAIVAAMAVHHPVLAAVGAGAVALSELTVTCCWAVTGQRAFPGIGGKPDRTLAVAAIAIAAPLVPAGVTAGMVGLLVGLLLLNLGVRLRHALRVTHPPVTAGSHVEHVADVGGAPHPAGGLQGAGTRVAEVAR